MAVEFRWAGDLLRQQFTVSRHIVAQEVPIGDGRGQLRVKVLHGEAVVVLIQTCQYLSLAYAVTHIDVSCQQFAGHAKGQHRLIARSHVPGETHHTVSLIHDSGDLHGPGHLSGLLVLMVASQGGHECKKEDTNETCRETGTAESSEFHDVLLVRIS